MRAIKNEVYSPQGKPFPFTPKKKITDPRSSDSWLETVKLQSGKTFLQPRRKRYKINKSVAVSYAR